MKQEKAPHAELNAQLKEQRQDLKASQKVEREALKAARKAGKKILFCRRWDSPCNPCGSGRWKNPTIR